MRTFAPAVHSPRQEALIDPYPTDHLFFGAFGAGAFTEPFKLAVRARARALRDFYIMDVPTSYNSAIRDHQDMHDEQPGAVRYRSFFFPMMRTPERMSWIGALNYATNFLIDHPGYLGGNTERTQDE